MIAGRKYIFYTITVVFLIAAVFSIAVGAKSKIKTRIIGGIEFVSIPGGCFEMGSEHSQEAVKEKFDYDNSDEFPVHRVCVKPFWMGKFEVTQAQWQAVMGRNRSHFQNGQNGVPSDTSRHPVEMVSWDEVQVFVKKFNGATGQECHLPGESQWEYAARAGTKSYFHTGDCISSDTQANYDGNYPGKGCPKGKYEGKTVAVGSYSANSWGLHDMHGNVREWVQDRWHINYASTGSATSAPVDGSAWESGESASRLVRGGSWGNNALGLRSAIRSYSGLDYSISDLGFRLACSPK